MNYYPALSGGGSAPTGTYEATERSSNIDMGADANYRYLDTTQVPNENAGTYTFPAGDTGSTKDLGEANTYRYVNAESVYNAGRSGTLPNTLTFGCVAISSDGRISIPWSSLGQYTKFRISHVSGDNVSYYANGGNLRNVPSTSRATGVWHSLATTFAYLNVKWASNRSNAYVQFDVTISKT